MGALDRTKSVILAPLAFALLAQTRMTPDDYLRVEKIAPLGDPIAISVSGYNLSLRLNEAQNIFVEIVAVHLPK